MALTLTLETLLAKSPARKHHKEDFTLVLIICWYACMRLEFQLFDSSE